MSIQVGVVARAILTLRTMEGAEVIHNPNITAAALDYVHHFRARQIQGGSTPMLKEPRNKATQIAQHELQQQLVKFRIFKVTPEFLNEIKAVGISNLSAEDIVKFRIFKIDPQFIREARAAEPNITVEEMVQMKIGVRRRTR